MLIHSVSLVPRSVFFHYPRVTIPLTSLLVGWGLVWLTKAVRSSFKRHRELPDGPWGLPLLGYLPFLKKHTYLQFDELAKKYGPLFRLKLGGCNVIVVSEWSHVKDAFANDALLARPEQTLFPGIIDHLSILEMSGDDWKEHRRLSMQILRSIGLTKSTLEIKVKKEINKFLELLGEVNPVNFSEIIGRSVSNNITILVFGHTYEYDDPAKTELDEHINTVFREYQFAGLLAFAPWLAKIYIALGKGNLDRIAEAVLYGDKFVEIEVDRHRAELQLDTEPADYIDGFLKEMAKREEKRIPEGTFNLEVLKRNVVAFYGGGIETVTSTMMWIMYYLVSYPESQLKIREEIAEVIGFSRQPDYADRSRMPYTMAFINEVHRMGSVLAVNLLRRASKDTYVGKYFIPKDCYVLFNFWSVHRDPKIFKDPETFNPTRFLSRDGTQLLKVPQLVPFSGGKRMCPGESLASMELFLYVTFILQKFKIKEQPGSVLSPEADFGVARRPANLPPLIFEELKECTCDHD